MAQQSPEDPRLLNGLTQFNPIPKCLPLIPDSPIYNIYPNKLPPSTSWSSSCSCALRLPAEKLFQFPDTIRPIDVTVRFCVLTPMWLIMSTSLDSLIHSCIWSSNNPCYTQLYGSSEGISSRMPSSAVGPRFCSIQDDGSGYRLVIPGDDLCLNQRQKCKIRSIFILCSFFYLCSYLSSVFNTIPKHANPSKILKGNCPVPFSWIPLTF